MQCFGNCVLCPLWCYHGHIVRMAVFKNLPCHVCSRAQPEEGPGLFRENKPITHVCRVTLHAALQKRECESQRWLQGGCTIKLSFTPASLSVLSWLCHQEELEECPCFHQERKGDESFCYASARMCLCGVNWQKNPSGLLERQLLWSAAG